MMMKRLMSAARPGILALEIAGLAAIYAGGAVAMPTSASAAEGPYLYVANQEAAAVTVIDLETHEVVEVIDLEAMGYGANAKPHHIAVEPDGSFWYVSLIAANQVLKFDRENRLVASVEFERPGLLALHPSEPWLFVGRSMAAVNPPQRIGRIDRTSMEVEEYDVFIPRPHALLASPDGDWVYVGSLGENSVVTVGAESGEAELLRLPGSGEMPHVLVQYAISPDGRTLVATAEMTAKLLVFDVSEPTAPALVGELDVGARPWHPSWSADGRWIWFGNLGANEVTLVDTSDWSVSAVVRGEGLAEPHGSALSPDGSRLYVANRNETGSYESSDRMGYDAPGGTVVVIDTATREIIDVIETPPYASGIGLASQPR
ncbi:YncE family protein [Candidatus Palauibacter sp.]|uniref:YncE family protein n=1 Tax=Candidatus Palauibacter sp. TaxID=3101350 RepID=UPI003B522203